MPDLDEFASQPKAPEQAGQAEKPKEAPKSDNKKIFVFCDGTGNEFAGRESIMDPKAGGNSNVVKLYTALSLDSSQVAYYHPGVGTMGDPTKKGVARLWSKIKGLAFGLGFEENVLDAYRYLMQHYSSGDRVYIVGFSRGAYTARALAGLLHGYGLLCRGNEGHLLYAWQMYKDGLTKSRKTDQKFKKAHTIETDYSFRDTFSHKDFIIEFMGLWDTVSSVGWITTPLRLLHLAQNPSVVTGRHAISIEERRCFYHDNLWGKPVDVQVPKVLLGTPRGNELTRKQDILQVWFPGVHSDVGGSYPQLECGLALTSLKWMIEQIKAAGAEFDGPRTSAVLAGPDLDDWRKLNEVIREINPAPKSTEVHPSMKGAWWVLESFPHRFYDTEEEKEKLRLPWGGWRHLSSPAILHPTVLARYGGAHARHKPPNLKRGTITTPPLQPDGNSVDLTGYGSYLPPMHTASDWRSNLLLVLVVKILLVSIPMLIFYRPIGAVVHLLTGCACWPSNWLLDGPHCTVTALGALVAAAALVLFWELVRLIRPRN